ncbi:MAG: GntR family transcriptional regulator [Firmicutes bacterium]|nr:GntR family transcriptional regulator [Bacillota bacterium]
MERVDTTNQQTQAAGTKGPDTYSRLRAMILSGVFRSGQRLSERELAAQLSVSRTPVREALRQLVQEGTVVYQPRRGYRIASISQEQARHLFIVREALEGLAARLACQQGDPGCLAGMQASIERGRAAAREGHLAGLIAANQQFHTCLAESSANPYLISAFARLQVHIALMMSRSLATPRRPEETLREHQAIVDAVRARDAGSAEQLIREHIRKALQGYLRHLGDETG